MTYRVKPALVWVFTVEGSVSAGSKGEKER